jgi:predicted ATPase
MYVSRIELQNWKNFKSTEATLSRRCFFIGPNASGKSNLLDAFRFLRDLAQDGLSQAVDDRGGVSTIRCLAARKSPSIVIEVELSRDPETPLWLYRIEFNQDRQSTPKVRREIVRDLQSTGPPIVDRPNPDDADDEMLLTQTALEQILANREFREVAEYFESISYQHVIPQVVREPQEFSPTPVKNDPFGRDILQRIWDKAKHTREAWLRRISAILQEAVPQLRGLEVEMDDQGQPHLIGRFEHWRPHDARQNESQFSDGTLRLFGLMWAMFEGKGPLLLEEPELSLHPEVVRKLPQLLTELQEEIRKMKRQSLDDFEPRQLVVSTHSDELLRDGGIGADEVLLIKPDKEGAVLEEPDQDDRIALRNSELTAADVLLPKSGPSGQLALDFNESGA